MRSTIPPRPEVQSGLLAANPAAQSVTSENLAIRCYQNDIPSFVKGEMERLYQNCFSSTAAEHVDVSNTSTYVVCDGQRPITIFLFQCEKRRVKVVNGVIQISTEDLRRFADYIFDHYKSVNTIGFQSIRADHTRLTFPCQHFNASEDIVLTLPDTAQAYLDSLGKSTRKYIKYHLNRPKRHFPTYCYRVCVGEQIDEQLVQDIIDLNTARMGDKNKRSTIDEEQRNWIVKIAKMYGFIGVATINGRVCAGVICSRVGANYFMHVIAHDPQYNEYRLGMLCCYTTICEAIACGGKEFHFLWGQGEYKYRLLGVQRDLDNLTIYRSRAHYFFNLGLVLQNVFASYLRRLKVRLEKTAGTKTFSSRLIGGLLEVVHGAQRLKARRAAAVRHPVRPKSHEK